MKLHRPSVRAWILALTITVIVVSCTDITIVVTGQETVHRKLLNRQNTEFADENLAAATTEDVASSQEESETALNNPKIVGGEESEAGEFPYYVDLDFCGGALITPRVVLTAGHCDPQRLTDKPVTVGALTRDDKFDPGKRITVLEGIAHPKFGQNGNLNNDFGLLLLERPYALPSNIQVVLNDQNRYPPYGTEMIAIGMGSTKYGGDLVDNLRDVSIPFVPGPTCKNTFGMSITRKMLCAGDPANGKDTCQGDSGSPLIHKMGNTHRLVGVVSWGINCAEYPGVYARISRGLDWIQNVVCNVWKVEAMDSAFCRKPDNSNGECRDEANVQVEGDPEKNCQWVKKRPKKRCRLKTMKKKAGNFCKESCGKCRRSF